MQVQGKKKQGGFSLVELGVVMLIITVLGLVLAPRVQGYLLKGKVKGASDELTQAVVRLNANRTTGSSDFAGATTKELVKVLMPSSAFELVDGSTPSVSHKLSNAGGTVTFGPGTLLAANDAGLLTIGGVDESICQDLANSLSATAVSLGVNGTTAKNTAASPQVPYNSATATTSCNTGSGNTITLLIRP